MSARVVRRICLIGLAVIVGSGATREPVPRTWYFSSCATGCAAGACGSEAGTIENPYCLDPGGDGTRESIAFLFDGSAPEAVPGDTLRLCAGGGRDPCRDDVRAATFHVQCTGTITKPKGCVVGRDAGCASASVWFDARTEASRERPITIQADPGETIVLSGDSDGDGVFDDGGGACTSRSDVDHLINTTARDREGHGGYVWRGLIFEKSGSKMMELSNPRDWIFEACTLRYSGSPMWSGVASLPRDLYSADRMLDCSRSDGSVAQAHALKVANLKDGGFTFRDGAIHSACGFAHRDVSNEEGGGVFTFEGNEYYNVGAVSNDFGNWDWGADRGARFTWRRNDIHDCNEGIAVEDRNRFWLIEDNSVACRGEYQVQAQGRCTKGISINDGDMRLGGSTADIVVRRNRVYAVGESPAYQEIGPGGCARYPSRCGWFVEAIAWQARCAVSSECESGPADGGKPAPWACCTGRGTGTCGPGNSCTAAGGLIENNTVWHHRAPAGDSECVRGGICVRSNDGDIVVRGNTVYDSEYGIALDATSPGVAYTLEKNLVAEARSGPELWIAPQAAASIVRDNNLFARAPGRRVIQVGGGPGFRCGAVARFQSGNRCAPPRFLNVRGSPTTWDLGLEADAPRPGGARGGAPAGGASPR